MARASTPMVSIGAETLRFCILTPVFCILATQSEAYSPCYEYLPARHR